MNFTYKLAVPLVCAILAVSCKKPQPAMTDITPPKAVAIPHAMEHHGDIRTDDYYWLRDRESDSVLSYLRAENEYYQAMTAHTEAFQEAL